MSEILDLTFVVLLCITDSEAEITTYYFLHCHFDNTNRSTLKNDLNNTESNIPNFYPK